LGEKKVIQLYDALVKEIKGKRPTGKRGENRDEKKRISETPSKAQEKRATRRV